MNIGSSLRTLISIKKGIVTELQNQGLNMTNHGYSTFPDDVGDLFENIHSIIGDVGDGGESMTITEKLNHIINLANQKLHGGTTGEGVAETVADAVLQLIQKIEELENSSQDNT